MPRFLRILLSGVSFIVFYAGATVIAFVLLPIQRLRMRDLPEDERRRALDAFFVKAYRFAVGFMAAFGLFRFTLPDPSEIPPGPKVVVANHPSLLDVLFIKSLVPGAVLLVKAALFKTPSLRQIFTAAGDFKGPDSSGQSFGQTSVLDIFVERLRAGYSVVVFPEGTRSPAWRLHRFRRGAAEAAIRAEVPILPIFIHNDPPTLKKGDKWYDMPKRVPIFELEVLPLIDPAGRSSREVTAEIHDLLATRLEAARERARQAARERG